MDEEFLTDFICPICHEEEERLLYTVCNHKMCEKCKSKLFNGVQEGRPISCPFCRMPLRKRDIRDKSQEEVFFEMDIAYRRRIAKE